MHTKAQIHQRFIEKIQTTINGYQQALADLQHSMANETKSTAGDKYETALAMLQLEDEQTKQKLLAAKQQLATLQMLASATPATHISPGSLITTNRGTFYMSTAAGKMDVDGQIVIAISPSSPLGQQLMQKKVGDAVHLPPLVYQILRID
jgi:transcription elongation GreA/GreB family factor